MSMSHHGMMEELPEIGEIMEMAFPCAQDDEKMGKQDDDDEVKWQCNYLSKRYNGMDPALGGYPSPLDTRYPFEGVAPWMGQPGAGMPHHCPEDSDPLLNAKTCPKLVTDSDNGIYGAGHIPPHIALRAVSETWREAYKWFDYSKHHCDIPADTLLGLIRRFYKRAEDGSVDYPPPVIEGTPEYFPYEFPGNAGPHHCTQEYLDAGHSGEFCPYEPEGRYRHPHIALAALNVYLANMHMPDKCGTTWMSQLPTGVTYPPQGADTSVAFPAMENEDDFGSQPALPYVWPGPAGTKKKAPLGLWALHLVVQDHS